MHSCALMVEESCANNNIVSNRYLNFIQQNFYPSYCAALKKQMIIVSRKYKNIKYPVGGMNGSHDCYPCSSLLYGQLFYQGHIPVKPAILPVKALASCFTCHGWWLVWLWLIAIILPYKSEIIQVQVAYKPYITYPY